MATKFHINDEGQVKPCKAFLRKCSFTDYDSERKANNELERQVKEQKRNDRTDKLREICGNMDIDTFVNADFSGYENARDSRFGKPSPRNLANTIEEAYQGANAADSIQKIISSVQIVPWYTNNYTKKIDVSLGSIPRFNEEDEVIENVWTLKVADGRSRESYNLDFSDHEEGIAQAKSIISEALIQNVRQGTPQNELENDTNAMVGQVEKAYLMMDEEVSGPYHVYDRNSEIGTFAGSYGDNISVNVNYNESFFRGRTFDRFINDEKSSFKYMGSSFYNIQVFDNENRKSKAGWRFVLYENEWYIQTIDKDGQNGRLKLEDSKQAYNFMYDFVINNMRTNDAATAKEKAKYCYDLMNDLNSLLKLK